MAVEWAFDAGAGKHWILTGASCTKDDDGGSVKFKVGWSNDGLDSGVTWVDGAWRTITEVDTNAGNGDYDDHKYLHVKAQFNSDATQQPKLTDFTISGTKTPNIWIDERSNTKAVIGTYSWKLGAPPIPDTRLRKQFIDGPREGETIRASIRVDVDSYDAGDVIFELYDETNSASIVKETIAEDTSDFVTLTVIGEIPAACTSASVRFGLENAANTIAYFDDVRVERLTPRDIKAL